ncbi:Cytochrome P450 family protein, partial [Metarhizium brunneum ARSEF 3297]
MAMGEKLISTVLRADRQDILRYAPFVGIALLSILVINYFRNPLRSVPGPFWARFSNLWLVYHTRQGRMHRKMIELHGKYGPLVRLGPHEISTADIDSLRTIYGPGNDFRKSDWYMPWQGNRKWDLFAERNESIHRAQRRLVSHIYSLSNMKKLEPYVDSAIVFLLKKLASMQGQEIDVGRWTRLFAYDVIGEVTFSNRFGFMDKGIDDGAFTMIDNILQCANWVGHIPWFYYLSIWLAPIIGNHLAITQRQGKLLHMSQQNIRERKKRGTDRNDMLEQLFEVQREKPDKLDDICVASMAASNIFAGSDSTSVSISAFLYHTLRNPEVKKKLMDEIDEHAAKNNIPRGAVFDLEIINNMPFLQACMYEALRCHPAVGVSLGRVVPPSGLQIGEQFIPGGSGISANAWVIHQNEDIFGQDAHNFRPERWMEEPERVATMRRNFLSFGAGSRYCIGRNVGWLEMSKASGSCLFLSGAKLTTCQ